MALRVLQDQPTNTSPTKKSRKAGSPSKKASRQGDFENYLQLKASHESLSHKILHTPKKERGLLRREHEDLEAKMDHLLPTVKVSHQNPQI